jgi:spore maturation protein CgeB
VPSWYQQTRIVLNVFREVHHYNAQKVPATSLNPRVYEALACGALVVSEWRHEVDEVVPEMPTFRTVEECVALVSELLADPERAESIRVQCAARLAGHTYANRLQTVLAAVRGQVAA